MQLKAVAAEVELSSPPITLPNPAPTAASPDVNPTAGRHLA
jgi:hypothetical protein